MPGVCPGGFTMIRSVAAILIGLLMMGALALTAQADTINSSGTLTGTTTLTAIANPCSCVFDDNFTGSGTDSVSGAFTTTNMGILIFSSPTMFTQSGTFEDVLAGGTLFGTFTGSGTVSGDTTVGTTDTVITGGTGMFAGDTGESTGTGTSTT